MLETSSLDSFTANKIILSKVVNLRNSTLAELADKSRKEIVKTVLVIQTVKIIFGFLVVWRKVGYDFFIDVLYTCKTSSVSPFLAWGDFHARSRFARSTIPEEKWGTTSSLWNISNLLAAVLFFLRDTVDIVGRFYGNEWKVIPFWIHRFFSQWKVLMIRIFYLILNLSKETHLKI